MNKFPMGSAAAAGVARLGRRFEDFLLTVWVGGMLMIGYVVAPVLFTTLDDRGEAALVAGKLFSKTAEIGLYCGSLLLLMLMVPDRRRQRLGPLLVLWLVLELAGRIGGLSMAYIALVYLVILAALLVMQAPTGYARRWPFWVLVAMLICTAIGYFYLMPGIEAMRQSGEAARASDAFKLMHRSASILYLATSLGGLALVWLGLPRNQGPAG